MELKNGKPGRYYRRRAWTKVHRKDQRYNLVVFVSEESYVFKSYREAKKAKRNLYKCFYMRDGMIESEVTNESSAWNQTDYFECNRDGSELEVVGMDIVRGPEPSKSWLREGLLSHNNDGEVFPPYAKGPLLDILPAQSHFSKIKDKIMDQIINETSPVVSLMNNGVSIAEINKCGQAKVVSPSEFYKDFNMNAGTLEFKEKEVVVITDQHGSHTFATDEDAQEWIAEKLEDFPRMKSKVLTVAYEVMPAKVDLKDLIKKRES